MKEFREVEHATEGDTMRCLRGVALIKSLEKAGIKLPDSFSGDFLDTLMEQAASQGIRIPFKRYESYSKSEIRNIDNQIKQARFDLPGIETREEPPADMTPSQLKMWKEFQMRKNGYTQNFHGKWVKNK